MELELKHLAGYLPYRLGIYSETYGIKSIMTIIGNGGDNPSDSIESVLSGKFKPLLRPVSSLIKEIEVDGKRFIPIIELARLENGGGVFDYQIEKLLIEESGYIGLYYTSSTGLVEFSYDPKFMTFTMMLRHEDESYKCDLIVNHQLEMFQKLHEWHFDIYGLIDKGMAIAIED